MLLYVEKRVLLQYPGVCAVGGERVGAGVDIPDKPNDPGVVRHPAGAAVTEEQHAVRHLRPDAFHLAQRGVDRLVVGRGKRRKVKRAFRHPPCGLGNIRRAVTEPAAAQAGFAGAQQRCGGGKLVRQRAAFCRNSSAPMRRRTAA